MSSLAARSGVETDGGVRAGQVEILQKALEVHEAMMGDLERRAAEAGVVLFGDEDDSEDE